MGSRKTSIALIALVTTVLSVFAATVKPAPAAAARGMLVGIYDPVQPIASPATAFKTLHSLRAQVIRLNLDWNLIAAKKPTNPTDPADPAYNWATYDAVLLNAAKQKIQVLFTIYGTPRWAQGKKKGINRMPSKINNLRYFSLAAAKRYSGKFKRDDGTVLPPVRKWLAWNEPNNPMFLSPQWQKVGKRRYIPIAGRNYVAICRAVHSGVHATHLAKEVVACGATDPRGNNAARSKRPSISPIAFLDDMHRYGLRKRDFDVYAHHPYYGSRKETPTTKPKGKQTVTLANLSVLTKRLGQLYGNKKLWITEYGYQTRPPDRLFGVTWRQQAVYLAQAYKMARKNPRVTMMLWFLLKDEKRLGGWQSGFFTAAGKKKPAYNTFRRLRH